MKVYPYSYIIITVYLLTTWINLTAYVKQRETDQSFFSLLHETILKKVCESIQLERVFCLEDEREGHDTMESEKSHFF